MVFVSTVVGYEYAICIAHRGGMLRLYSDSDKKVICKSIILNELNSKTRRYIYKLVKRTHKDFINPTTVLQLLSYFYKKSTIMPYVPLIISICRGHMFCSAYLIFHSRLRSFKFRVISHIILKITLHAA